MVSKLRLERTLRELTQDQLSQLTKIPQWRISLLERGKSPSSEEAAALSRALSIPREYLEGPEHEIRADMNSN